MRSLMLFLTLCAVATASGQGADATISRGMTREQVIQLLGKPVGERSYGGSTYLFYENGCRRSCGSSDIVILQAGSVVDAVFKSRHHHLEGAESHGRPAPTLGVVAPAPEVSASQPSDSTGARVTVAPRRRRRTTRAAGSTAAAPRAPARGTVTITQSPADSGVRPGKGSIIGPAPTALPVRGTGAATAPRSSDSASVPPVAPAMRAVPPALPDSLRRGAVIGTRDTTANSAAGFIGCNVPSKADRGVGGRPTPEDSARMARLCPKRDSAAVVKPPRG
ncbi:MAG: hypothetical protein M3068_05795 [Gemmatimonadota bacterium]|nr:hypothetical protein [Gemmatimonadota bacterium]